uniref:AB hydrolase-1 domain-containing protein n=1 Tax=Zonotrichia albicollis TaxID=44394 RepID=A0A8D2MA93_ZONAL
MWLLLVALCLAQGLEDAIPGDEFFHNPERFMNISEKILFHGYPSEEYEVMTEDGYFLSLNRIPHGKEGTRTPVLIVHGFCLDGGDWVDNLPENSLAFILADAGYDVWIGNNRGSSWSRRHRSLSTASEEFWDFSFHEMAVYDLPAMVGFILMQTEQKQLFYVGHAQGSSLGFIAFSSLPHLAKKIKLFFALAPVYTFHHVRGPVLKLAFLSDLLLKVQEVFLGGYCQNPGISGNSCPLHYRCVLLLHLRWSRLDVYLSHFPDYTSVKNLVHWGQVTGVLSPCQLRPPSYEIEAMRVPVAVWSGGHDWVTPHKETERLLSRLTHVVHHEHFPDWNHFDHHWGLNAPQRMYQRMVAMMEENP